MIKLININNFKEYHILVPQGISYFSVQLEEFITKSNIFFERFSGHHTLTKGKYQRSKSSKSALYTCIDFHFN